MRVRFTVEALGHIAAFQSYIATNSLAAAVHIVDRIFATTDLLGEFPRLGHKGKVVGTRELTVPKLPYIIVYQAGEGDQLIILGVYHGAEGR
jgi:toxin ParE1/3/4